MLMCPRGSGAEPTTRTWLGGINPMNKINFKQKIMRSLVGVFFLAVLGMSLPSKSHAVWSRELVNSPVGSGSNMAMARDAAGNPHVVYETSVASFTSSGYDNIDTIYYSRKVGNTWQTEIVSRE